MDELLRELYDGVMEGDREVVATKIQAAIQARLPAQAIVDSMSAAMTEVGSLFEQGEYFVPEMLTAARAMHEGMQVLKPQLVQAKVQAAGLVVAGTVQGDLHEIGKNLVCMMLECAGFTVIDLGMDVAPEIFAQAVVEHQPDILALSALLTTTMPRMGSTIQALRNAHVRDSVKVMVGGAPLNEDSARRLGADGYAKDASQAVKLAKEFIAGSKNVKVSPAT